MTANNAQSSADYESVMARRRERLPAEAETWREGFANTCPHCSHVLVRHRIERPVYDQRAVFRCECGCRVNGSVERLVNAL